MYKDYIKNLEKDSPYYISYSTYVRLTTSYFKKIINVILEDSDKFKLISGLGTFQIIKKKIKPENQVKRFYSTDWHTTLECGKKVTHLNEHSDGYKYLFYWNKRNAMTKNISKYRFIPTRTVKRTLAKYIKNRLKDYFEYDL
jgi:hypothetical protein